MTNVSPLTSGEIDLQIEAAAKIANYTEGIGVKGCNLDLSCWWVVYTRQGLEEQRPTTLG